ncbi:MAG: molecular chaperone HtpG, partial [Acetanaerobacterium sp.]
MAKKQFKAESKRLLDLMINSIYTHKEIFLRELISNSSDAMDKLYFRSLTDPGVGLGREDFSIRLSVDKDQRLLTVSDNGCGMTKAELESNLGVIASSGSLKFKKELDGTDDVNIIGQFGVGFYSAFMVCSKVTVISRAHGAQEAFKWESTGAEGYTVEPSEKDSVGTDVYLTIKENEGEETYDEFLESYRIAAIVKKYSDYIRYPIKMDMEHEHLKEGSDSEYEKIVENKTLNSMVPLWNKNKSEVTPEEYNRFYKDKFYDYTDPLRVIHSKTEGAATYNALLFIPGKAPFDYYSKEYEKGLELYSSSVMIMEKCPDLLPDYFSFVKGLVDSQDLSLNISREMLQHDRQLKIIAGSLDKKIRSELLKMLKDERETYEKFYKDFGMQLKVGAYTAYGAHKDHLKDLLLFYSAVNKKPVTFEEYVSSMKEDQEFIYYAAGSSIEQIALLPQTELVLDKGFDILYLTDDVDEFALRVIDEYDGKKFKSVSADDLNLTSDEEKEEIKKQSEEHKDLFEAMRAALDGKVKSVVVSSRLKTHPVCIASEGEITLEMEKVLNAM